MYLHQFVLRPWAHLVKGYHVYNYEGDSEPKLIDGEEAWELVLRTPCIARAQEDTGSPPPKAAIGLTGHVRYSGPLLATYDEFSMTVTTVFSEVVNLNNFLSASRHSLRILSIPFDDSTDLTDLTSLQQLTLHLDTCQRENLGYPDPYPNLLHHLPLFTQLKSLHLTLPEEGPPLNDTHAVKIVSALPRTLTSLSINGETRLYTMWSLLGSLRLRCDDFRLHTTEWDGSASRRRELMGFAEDNRIIWTIEVDWSFLQTEHIVRLASIDLAPSPDSSHDTMLTHLPPELIQYIFEILSCPFPQDLIPCCLTSKVVLQIAQPLLHKVLSISGGGSGEYRITNNSKAKLWTLQANPRLRPTVKRVSIESFDGFSFENGYEIQPSHLVAALIDAFQSAELFILEGIAAYPGVDSVVRGFQDHLRQTAPYRRTPIFRLTNGLESADTSLHPELIASYEGCDWPASEEAALNIDTFLRSSHQSLRRLWIPLTDTTNLYNFQNLELLTLRTSFEFAPRVVKNLTRVLPTLTSLRVLVLFATADSRFSLRALPAEMSCVTLPPLLDTLTFDLDVGADAVEKFVKSLPSTTTLKRLDCRFQEGDVDGLRSYSRSRGIRLRVNRNYLRIW
ncbi:hypothetical protein JCM5353_000747 [Sporobolomyces roseus]